MRIRLTGSGHAAGLLSELNRCRLSRLYCDVFLQVGNRSFSAHRAVLACASSHFRTLLSQAQPSSTYSIDFVSPTNFEKVLSFVYTGEILIDLIDVGVLYELADRLGVSELVRACHATFPDLRGSLSADCPANGSRDMGLEPHMVAAVAASSTAVPASASSMCSSAASCSSLSSSAGPPATPTSAAAPSPLLHTRTQRPGRETHTAPLPLELKSEDIQSHLGYGQMTAEDQMAGEHGLLGSSHLGQTDRTGPLGPPLQLKTEAVEGEQSGDAQSRTDGAGRAGICGSTSGPLPPSSEPLPSTPCNFAPDSSAQLAGEACAPSSSPSSVDPLSNLQVGAVEGGVLDIDRGGALLFREVEEGGSEQERDPLAGDGAIETTEEEQWRQLADEIIELSDDENYMEDEEDEDDEDDLVCVENGGGEHSVSQAPGSMVSCKACSMSFPADPSAVRSHAQTHLTETGLCRVCGASFADPAAGFPHALAHTGVQLFTCDMCQLQFCSQRKLLRHRRQASSCYSLPPGLLTGANQSSELQCAVCTKTLAKDLQTVRDHVLSHVCAQSLSCTVCQLPQLSLCSLMWHALTHLSLPVYSCPHCAQSFLERPLLDRHMATHGEEAVAQERVRTSLASSRVTGGDAGGGGLEELRCFMCPQTFRSTSAFHYHLSLHTSESLGGAGGGGGQNWPVKRKADQAFDFPSSSCSSASLPTQREAGSLVKLSNLGFSLGVGFNLPDKILSGAGPSFPSALPGLLTNGSTALDRAAVDAAAGVRGKWYRCRYCGKRFAHSGEFTYHLRIHTGEKPYQCKVCLRFFRGRSTMICHLKTHAGALMYRCTVCGLYFSTLKLVSSHMEVHKDHLPPDFHIEQTFMYNDHSKEPLPTTIDT